MSRKKLREKRNYVNEKSISKWKQWRYSVDIVKRESRALLPTLKDAKSILRSYFPILVPDDKLSICNTGKKGNGATCEFQVDSNSQTSWEIEMMKHIINDEENKEGQI